MLENHTQSGRGDRFIESCSRGRRGVPFRFALLKACQNRFMHGVKGHVLIVPFASSSADRDRRRELEQLLSWEDEKGMQGGVDGREIKCFKWQQLALFKTFIQPSDMQNGDTCTQQRHIRVKGKKRTRR